MSETYLSLKKKFDELTREHNKLKLEYSENFMIQSMNDMKATFEEKEEEIQALSKSNDRLRNINYHLCENLTAVQIMIDTVFRKVKEMPSSNAAELFQLEMRLKFIEEIIENCLKKRDEMLFTFN